MQKIIPVITIDGPSGTGKGTVSYALAQKLHWNFLDSGLLYRALAYAVSENPNANIDEKDFLYSLVKLFKVTFLTNENDFGQVERVFFAGVDISSKLRSETVSISTSKIAVNPNVRAVCLDWQRSFRAAPGLIADGRDMGTVVFPDAMLKIFLTADANERAKRRYEQLKEQGISVSLSGILNDLIARDKRDTERAIAPLVPAQDAICIDSTKLTIDEVLREIVRHFEMLKAKSGKY